MSSYVEFSTYQGAFGSLRGCKDISAAFHVLLGQAQGIEFQRPGFKEYDQIRAGRTAIHNSGRRMNAVLFKYPNVEKKKSTELNSNLQLI
eukprot:scaffold5159_cov80-Skeletonema_dohrnii-CCMP3373.AAC.5